MKNWDATSTHFADWIREYLQKYNLPALVKTRCGETVLVTWCSVTQRFVDVNTHVVWCSNGLHPYTARLDLYEFHWPIQGVLK